MAGKVYLVGAGPYDSNLLTLRGARVLKTAQAVLYDNLISEEILSLAPDDCELVYVGKRVKNGHAQAEINELLLKYAGRFARVVRLKGGDPFIFGRGGEECEFLKARGIAYETVPGVSSVTGAAEAAGLPLTHRGLARAFHVMTGHTAADTLPPNLDLCAKLEGTLVFVMAVQNLRAIASALLEAGKPGSTPACVIERGCSLSQRRTDGTLAEIASLCEERGVQAPALFMVGKTCALDFTCPDDPLASCRVALTGTAAFTASLKEKFGARGVKALSLPLVKIRPRQLTAEALLNALSKDVLVFTSGNGVRCFFKALAEHALDVRRLYGRQIAAIGRGTAQALKERGIIADIMPSVYTTQALGEVLAEKLTGSGKSAALLRASNAERALYETLTGHGIDCAEVPLYDSVSVPCDFEKMLLEINAARYLVFGSAFGVRAFFERLKEGAFTLAPRVKPVCIGSATARTLRKYLPEREIIVSAVFDADGIVNGVTEDYLKHAKT